MAKLNCWEFEKCGREPGGTKSTELGVCPATTETRLDGINGGRNGGRACWAIVGTLCRGEVQGTLAHKLADCMECEFYKCVHEEEGKNCVFSKDILERLK